MDQPMRLCMDNINYGGRNSPLLIDLSINLSIYKLSIHPSIHYGSIYHRLIPVGNSMDNVLRYHIWEQEACIKLCTMQSHRTGMVVETITGVLDVKDMTLGQITRDFLGK